MVSKEKRNSLSSIKERIELVTIHRGQKTTVDYILFCVKNILLNTGICTPNSLYNLDFKE